jgi:hypothetical protein
MSIYVPDNYAGPLPVHIGYLRSGLTLNLAEVYLVPPGVYVDGLPMAHQCYGRAREARRNDPLSTVGGSRSRALARAVMRAALALTVGGLTAYVAHLADVEAAYLVGLSIALFTYLSFGGSYDVR